MMRSPAFSELITLAMAAIPDDVAMAAAPPSSSVTASSSHARLGLLNVA